MVHAWETALQGDSLRPIDGDTLPLADARLAVLVTLLQMHDASLDDIVAFALESGVRLTGSVSGYAALLGRDDVPADLYVCSLQGPVPRIERVPMGACPDVAEAVVETVRRGRPAVSDEGDMSGETGGLRRLDVPILDADQIVSVVGVAGKCSGYDRADVWQLTLLLHGAWRFLRRRRSEQEIRETRAGLERCVHERTAELEDANVRLRADVEERRSAEESQRRTEERLRASDARFRTLMESLEDVVFTVDSDLRFSGLFGRRVDRWLHAIGRRLEGVLGTTPSDLFGADGEVHEAAFARALAGEHTVYEFSMDVRDRRVRFQTALQPIVDAAGLVTGIVGVGRDITERRALESQLLQSQKLESIGQLAAGIAHEINTPIQFVGDNLRFLQDAYGTLQPLLAGCRESGALGGIPASELDYLSTEVPSAISQSLDGVGRVAAIVRAMKAYSHPDSGQKSEADINAAIESTVAVARHEWKYVATVRLDLAADLPRVWCYAGEFNQAVLNILINAAHAIEETMTKPGQPKGQISISTRPDGGWVEIRIADTGPGIPEQIRSRIFDPFFTTKPVGRGTGQGLTLAHAAIVSRLGGSLTFETETGQGTAFILRIPVNAP